MLDSLRQDPPRPTWGRGRLEGRFQPSWSRRLRKGPAIVHDTVAVTPVIGTVMVLAISVIGIASVLTWGLPNIQQTRASTETEGVLEQFMAIDQVAEQVMRGGAVGKASEAKLTLPTGTLQRTNGTVFVVGVSPYHADFSNDHRFYITGIDDDDPESITVQSVSLAHLNAMHLSVSRYTLTEEGPSQFYQFSKSGHSNITLDEDVRESPTRIEIYREYNGADHLILDAWIFPVGSLLYQRHASFGNVNLLLENSAVISEMETGRFIRSNPLATIERDTSEHPVFFALFPMVFADNSTYPGVQAAGAGTYPLLLGLAGNSLRVNGEDAVSLQVKAFGDRDLLWMQHFAERYKFVPNMPADPSVRIDAGFDPFGKVKPFDVVLMESTIEVTLKHDTAVLNAG